MCISLWFHKIITYFCVIKSKGIKKTLKIVGFSIAGIILFFGILLILFQNSKIQGYIAQAVVKELSAKLHTKVSVGRVEYKLFNTMAISDLYVEDLQRDTLLFVHEADAHFDFWKFSAGRVHFTSIDLDQLYGNLIVDKSGHSNLDFVIKAFQKPTTNDTTVVEYQIKKFRLKNSRFDFTNFQQMKTLPQGVFNGNKLKFRNIDAEIALDVFKKDTLNAQILGFSALEQSGLEITDIETHIYGSKRGVQIPSLVVEMPNSKVKLEDVKLKYDSLADLNEFVEKVRLNAPITLSTIALSDLKAFVPQFKNAKGRASIKGLISGRISSLRFQKMEIKYGKSFLLNADLDINGLPDIREAFIYGQINELDLPKTDVQDLVSELSNRPFVLPKELDQLGLVKYKGNITGFLSNLVAYGNISTNLGSISTDILLKFENHLKDLSYNGTVKTTNFQLGRLLNNSQLGKIAFNLNTKGSKKDKESLQGTITAKVPEFQFKNYSYRDIQFNGAYDGKGFDGRADVEDDNIHAHFNGVIDLSQKLPIFDFDLKMAKINPNALKLIDTYPGATLSFNGKTNMVGNSLDNINGFVRFDSITFSNKGKTLNVDNIQLVSRIQGNYTHVNVASDYVNGSLSGNFKYSTIGKTINRIIQNYLPSLSTADVSTANQNTNHLDVDLTVENTNEISDVLGLGYKLEGISKLKGFIDEGTNRISINGNIPMLESNKRKLQNLTVHCENSKQQLQLTTRALMLESFGNISLFMTASAAKDSVLAQFGWQNSHKVTNAGQINAITKFRKESNKTAASLSILPSEIIISDSIWTLHPCVVDFKADSTIHVNNFLFENHKQFVHVNGIASKKQNEGLTVEMNDLNLEFLLSNLLKIKTITFGGNVTGKATLYSLLKQPIYEANLFVKNVALNHKLIGDATLFSTWDKENSQVLASGTFVNDKNEKIAVVDGVYVPKNDSLDFMFDAHDLSVEFLDRYFESVVQNFKGYATGKIRMFGPSKILGFKGAAYIDKGQGFIKTLKTSYYFNDTVHLDRKTIEFRNIKVYDQERNQGQINAFMRHDGTFQNMTYDAYITGRNILALNTHSGDNDYFFGKAYANGTVHIFGNDKVANILVNAVSQPKTKCYINMGSASTATDNSFINFVNKKIEVRKEEVVQKPAQSNFNVKINLQLDVTPDAEMELIVDPKGGDVITGKGNGNLRVEFDTFSDVKLFGTYTIDNGYYLFTLQNLFRKEFKVNQGSTIAWTGDPFNAQVDIKAVYPLTASLTDLIDKSQLGNMRSSVPVNCVLKLTDNLMKPTINFDIDLPQSDEGVKQRVRNIITTDEMMSRQILYLLVFNKFYSADTQSSANQVAGIGTSEAFSFATSTVSAQLNNWMSKMLKTNNLSFGFDYRQTNIQTGSSDVQAQINYQPNKRLILNGNVGYRNDNVNTSTNANKFIGDLDVEYLLTESGKLRFKAYNHTVDRYQLRAAKTTQGAGFLYKEDFETVPEMLRYYLHALTGIGKKKVNEKTK
ncbi:MAG: translocation/assembly module TamB domain-containing protein [Paludibacter sp.]|nr:translocation/assembly module TamB domain-containing protein [Paludibacter sp.]